MNLRMDTPVELRLDEFAALVSAVGGLCELLLVLGVGECIVCGGCPHAAHKNRCPVWNASAAFGELAAVTSVSTLERKLREAIARGQEH